MRVTSPARPVFLAVFLALTAIGAVRAQDAGRRAQDTGKEPVAVSPKPTKQGAKPATPAAAPDTKASPVAASSPKPKAQSPKPASDASPTPNTQHPTPGTVVTTPKGDTINVTVAAPAPPEPQSNNWAAGVIGLALLVGLGFFGMRYARQRGLTVPDALQKMGVEMPQDGVAQGARPLKPIAPPQPPLPSLADLPSAGPASMAGAGVAPPMAATPVYQGAPRLVGLEGVVAGVTLDLNDTFTVGRDAENTLALTQDTTVSRRHAAIERQERGQNGGWSVRDNESSNGTYVNGVRISGAMSLQSGDEIQIGSSRLRFEG